MLENKRSALSDVALETSLVLPKKQSASAFDLLRKTCPASFECATDMRIVAIGAAHFAFQNGMVVRHLKFGAHFEVALKTRVR